MLIKQSRSNISSTFFRQALWKLLPIAILVLLSIWFAHRSGVIQWYENAVGKELDILLLGACLVLLLAIYLEGTWRLLRAAENEKLVRSSLAKSEAQLKSLFQTIPDLVWLKDTHGVFLACNPAFERLYGKKESEIIDKTDNDFVTSDLAKFFRDNDRAALAGGVARMNEECLTFAEDGQSYFFETIKIPVKTPDGKAIGVMGVARDITDRKQAETSLQASQEQLRQLLAHQERTREEDRKRMAREIHDQLGQYLLALRIDISLLPQIASDNVAVHERVNGILKNLDGTVKHVRLIINNLRPAVMDLGFFPAIEWLVKDFERRTGLACELIAVEEELHLTESHATTLFRVLQEALSNVDRHAKATRVRIALQRTGDAVVMKVVDNGIGLSAVPNGARQTFGILGIRERVATHGGEARLVSDKGTQLTVSLPVA